MTNSTRTSLRTIEELSWWYRYFFPYELVFMFYLDRGWSIYDVNRVRNIADAFRNCLQTNHSDQIIRSLLTFFHSRPNLALLPEKMIDNSLFFNETFIHMVPFINVCPLCQRLLAASDSYSQEVKVICEKGKVLMGKAIHFEII